jgi:Acyl-CoA reductase (LuxC)
VLTTIFTNPTHASVRARTLLVRFDPSPELTAVFSNRSDIRAVWGGDAAVKEVRSVPLPPLSTELVFGDRFSMALLKSRGWLTSDAATRGRLIHGFLNDSYWFMLMACSSPRLVTWIGSGMMSTKQARVSGRCSRGAAKATCRVLCSGLYQQADGVREPGHRRVNSYRAGTDRGSDAIMDR